MRDRISYVSQDSFFFSGSIFENLTFGINRPITIEDINNACLMADATDFINGLPLRYDTILEENASNLSGGQRQRLSIARALLKDADILILDEATSQLDTISEGRIISNLNQFKKGKLTKIVIAHRLSTIMHCDNIFVLSNGEIVEQGNHKSLLEQNLYYKNLWNNQLPKELFEITV